MNLEITFDFIESNWDIRPKKVSFIEEGDSTNNWRVSDIKEETYILRNAGKFKHYVRFQCDILNFLHQRKFPYQIPVPVKARNHDFVVGTKEGNYLVYKYIEGKTLEDATAEDAFQVGLMLAAYHGYVVNFNWQNYQQLRSKDLLDTQKVTQFIMSCKRTVEEKVIKSELDEIFLSCFDGLVDNYIDILRKTDLEYYHTLPKIPCHGDFERRNIIKRRNKIVGFIDLGGITIDPSICDLQSCIQLNCMRNRQLDMDLAKAIVSGYTSHTELNRQQLELIPSLMYSEMLKTLCWIMANLAIPGSKVSPTEASNRIKILPWLKDHLLDLRQLLANV